MGTFWAHLSHDVDDFRARSVTSAARKRFALARADTQNVVVHFGRWDAFITITSLNLVGGVGSLPNATAIQ